MKGHSMRYLLAFLLFPMLALAQGPVTVTPGPGPVLVGSTAGSVALTGGTNGVETNMANIRIPAGSMGKNGAIQLTCLWTYTNSANTKTLTVRFTNASGSVAGGITGTATAATTTASAQPIYFIRNNNATNAQVMWGPTAITPFAAAGSTPVTLAIDTTGDTWLNINGTLALNTETITLNHCVALIMRAP